jgi:hypothetical protein
MWPKEKQRRVREFCKVFDGFFSREEKNSKVSAESLDFSDHELHVGARRWRVTRGHHAEEVGQTLVLQGLVAHHHTTLEHHALLHQRCNLQHR